MPADFITTSRYNSHNDMAANEVDLAFGNWLAGFIDGEGHFAIAERQRGGATYYHCLFKLLLHSDDAPILGEIVARTGLGSVRPARTHRPAAIWAITSQRDRLGLIELLDRCPLRAKKARDYAIWRRAVFASLDMMQQGGRFTNDWSELAALRTELMATRAFVPRLGHGPSSMLMTDDFGHWLAGFMDAEGCFHVATRRTGQHNCVARIALRGDDAPILHEIGRRTGVGYVRGRDYPDANPVAWWHVSKRSECLALVALFDAYPLRAKKREDYGIWRHAVQAWTRINTGANGSSGPSDWGEMGHLRAQLMAQRLGRRR